MLKFRCNTMFELWLLFLRFYTSVALVDTMTALLLSSYLLALFLALIASYSWQIFPVTVFIDEEDSEEQTPAQVSGFVFR